MKASNIDKAIASLEQDKADHGRVIDLAIAKLRAQQGTAAPDKPKVTRKRKGLPASEGL